jgi:hypothetical protein
MIQQLKPYPAKLCHHLKNLHDKEAKVVLFDIFGIKNKTCPAKHDECGVLTLKDAVSRMSKGREEYVTCLEMLPC